MLGSPGIDLIEIERLERALARRPGLARRLFTAEEMAYAAARKRPARHLAARFAAKEAVSKALTFAFRPSEIAIVGSSPPLVALSGRTAARAAELEVAVEVSLTHSRDFAAAVAVCVAARAE